MFRGRVVELATAAQILRDPVHPYSSRLFSSSGPGAVAAAAASVTASNAAQDIDNSWIEADLVDVGEGHLVRSPSQNQN